MERNIVLQLCRVLWDETDTIKVIIGMCDEHFRCKSHPYFIQKRPISHPTAFLSSPAVGYQVVPINKKGQVFCTFTNTNGYRTLFLDKKISEGIYRWTISVKYKEKFSFFYFGAAHCECACKLPFSSLDVPGSCSFKFWEEDGLFSGLRGIDSFRRIPENETKVESGSEAAVEADTITQTLSFFVQKKRVPHAISGVNLPMYLGVSTMYRPSFTSLSFYRLPSATHSSSNSSSACSVRLHRYRWAKDDNDN